MATQVCSGVFEDIGVSALADFFCFFMNYKPLAACFDKEWADVVSLLSPVVSQFS